MCVQPELHGMVPMEGGQFGGLQRMAMRWPNRLKQAAAVCNSLTLINRKQVVGDAADKQAFKAVEAQFVVRCCSCCLQQRDCRCAACDPDFVALVWTQSTKATVSNNVSKHQQLKVWIHNCLGYMCYEHSTIVTAMHSRIQCHRSAGSTASSSAQQSAVPLGMVTARNLI